MSLATHPTPARRCIRPREMTMTVHVATARAAQPRQTLTTTPAAGRKHPYALRTPLNPNEAEVLRSLTVGYMTTWPVGREGAVGAHFETPNDPWNAQLMIAAIRSFRR